MAEVTATKVARPYTNEKHDLVAYAGDRKDLRKGRLRGTDLDRVTSRMLATPEWFYTNSKLAEWRAVLNYLVGEHTASGTPYPAGLLKGLIQHYMSTPQTTARALLLLLSLAKIAGHMNVNLVSYYRKLATIYGFRLVVTAGAEALSSDATVPNNTFTVGATNDRVPTLRVRLTTEQGGGHYIGKYSGRPTTSQVSKYKHTHTQSQAEGAKGTFLARSGKATPAPAPKPAPAPAPKPAPAPAPDAFDNAMDVDDIGDEPAPTPAPKPRPKATKAKAKPKPRAARGDDSIFDTPSQRSARDQVRRDKDKQADIASRRRANQRAARDAARKRESDERFAKRRAAVNARKAKDADRVKIAKERLKRDAYTGFSAAFDRYRDQRYAQGNLNNRDIRETWDKYKERQRIEARDAQHQRDDQRFMQQEYDEYVESRRDTTKRPISEAGNIQRKSRQSQSGKGAPSYYTLHPVHGTRQHGTGLPESAASVLKHLLYRYGAPAVNQWLRTFTDYSRHEQFPGNARRELQFMDELARQYGMGLDSNRIEIPHTVGASADQFVYAGSGQAPPPPGTHRMSDGRVMADADQTGGTHAIMVGPGAPAFNATMLTATMAASVADPSNDAFWQPGWHAVGTALGPNQTPSYGDEPAPAAAPVEPYTGTRGEYEDDGTRRERKLEEHRETLRASETRAIDTSWLANPDEDTSARIKEGPLTEREQKLERTHARQASSPADPGYLQHEFDRRNQATVYEDANAHMRAANRVRLGNDESMRIGQYASDTLRPSDRDSVGLNASEYLGRYSTDLYNPGPVPNLTPNATDVTAHARAVVDAARPALDRIRDFWASANFTDAMLRVPWLTMTPVPADMQSIQWDRLSNSDLLGSIIDHRVVIGILAFAYKIGIWVLNRLRQLDVGTIIDANGQPRAMSEREEYWALIFLGGRQGNTLRNHVRALLYGGVTTAILGAGMFTGLLAVMSDQAMQNPDDHRAAVSALSWVTGLSQAQGYDTTTQVEANVNAMAQSINPRASTYDQGVAVVKSSLGMSMSEKAVMYAAQTYFGLGIPGVFAGTLVTEVVQSTIRGDGNALAGMSAIDKYFLKATGSALETMSDVIDRGKHTHDDFAISKIGSRALDRKPMQRLEKDISIALLPMVADMIQTGGGVFAAMSDTILQAADETLAMQHVELRQADPKTQMLAKWLKSQHWMQRWLVRWFGMMYGPSASEFFQLVETIVDKATSMHKPFAVPGDDGTKVQVLDTDDQPELTAYSLQLMVHRAINQKKPDGSLAHPNLQQYDPGMPTRANQVREATRNAISDMYNGESETYSSLRAAAYVMGQLVYVPEQETSFETLQRMSHIADDATEYVKDTVSSIMPTGAAVSYPNARMEMGF